MVCVIMIFMVVGNELVYWCSGEVQGVGKYYCLVVVQEGGIEFLCCGIEVICQWLCWLCDVVDYCCVVEVMVVGIVGMIVGE